jgi:hypothetical protein
MEESLQPKSAPHHGSIENKATAIAIRKMFLSYHYLALCVSADEAGGQGRILGWKCNEVCGIMEQVYSVYTAVYYKCGSA